jgi:predicted nucleotidyltransferase
MGKLLNTSHMTLQPHLQRLQKQKILQTTQVGRNKQYTLNKDNITTRYYLATVEELATISFLETNYLIKQLAAHIAQIGITAPLLLFGSQTKGYANEESDIDLFLIGKPTPNQTRHLKKFQQTYGKQINLKTATPENFNLGLRTGDILIKEIIANHIVITNPDPFVSALWRYHLER